jgi:deoxyribonuclease-4
MSISGGLHRAVDRAEAVRATALQVFVKSARQWTAKPLQVEEIDRFREALERGGLAPYTLAHASYLINIASADETLWRRSVAALRDELERCAALGIPFLVLHPGSHVGAGEEAGLRRAVRGVDQALGGRGRRRAAVRSSVTLLLENTAGQGTNLGHRFEHLGRILEQARWARCLGVCFDTCHALAAGYDLRDARSFRQTMHALDRAVGIERLRAFHLNDSKHALGSRRDRHEHIGRGDLGLDAFRHLLNDRRFADLPMVLETPKGEDLAEDRRNLRRLRSLVPEGRR